MGSIYGKPVKHVPVSKPPTTFDAAQKLHRQVETINLSIKQKNTLSTTYREKAKQCLANGKRDDARLLLEKKATVDKRITQLIKMASTLENQISALESASMNSDIVRAIAVSNDAMKNTNISTDDVSQMMDGLREKMDDVNDVANILSEPLGDTVDVTDELNSLMPSDSAPLSIPTMPTVPTTIHVVAQSSVEEEIRQLEMAS